MADCIKLNPHEHKIYFKGKSCKNFNDCKALCCRNWDINLAFEEYRRKIYESEPFCSNDKKNCSNPNRPCPHRSFRLKKNEDGSCVYLNKENRCKIYFIRPIVCRNFSCDNGFKIEPICLPSEDTANDVEICSFGGGLPLKAKFLFSPYLEMKKFSKMKNGIVLIFKDITSCKDKTVKLIGFDCFSSAKEISCLLGYFNGKNTLAAVHKKLSKSLAKQVFLNLVLYLIDEKVLVGLFG